MRILARVVKTSKLVWLVAVQCVWVVHAWYAYFTHGPNKSASAQYDNTRGAWLTQEGCTITERKEGRDKGWGIGMVWEVCGGGVGWGGSVHCV